MTSGSMMVLEPGTDNEETVEIQTDAAGYLYFTVTKAHAATFAYTIRGNPGPWTKYDPRLDNAVVPISVEDSALFRPTAGCLVRGEPIAYSPPPAHREEPDAAR